MHAGTRLPWPGGRWSQQQTVRIGFGPGHQVGQRFPAAVGRHQHTKRHARHLNNGLQVGHGVPCHMVHQRMAVHGDGYRANGVAIRRGSLHGGGDQRAGRAGLVGHHNALAQPRSL